METVKKQVPKVRFYCFKCCAFWCDDCIAAHNIIRTNKDHRVLAIKDFHDQDIQDVLKRPVFCQIEHHESEELKFFCKNCENTICNRVFLKRTPQNEDLRPKTPWTKTTDANRSGQYPLP